MKNKKYVIYVKRGFRDNDKNKKKVRDHCHQTGKFREAAYSKCNLRYKEFKEIPVIIHNGGYDTHFIINQLAIEFKGELNCIGDNMEKYITFFVPIKKILNNGKTVTHKWFVQIETLLLSDVYENFRNMCLKIYELDPVYVVSAPALACQSCLKKDWSKIRITNRLRHDINDWKRN